MNVLIVEDELHTANLLQEIIDESGDFKVVEKVETIVNAVEYLIKHQTNLDLLFFDIQLADGYCFEIFNHVDLLTPVVFCTAYDEYAMEAIKNNGIDYVLKPFKNEEIHAALAKYRNLKNHLGNNYTTTKFQTKKYIQKNFLTHYRDKTLVIKSEEIALFFMNNEVVYLQTFNGEKYPLYKSLDYIESVCDLQKFYRINRQMLIHREAIKSFQDYPNRKVMLELSANIKIRPIVSRLKVSAFKDWLKE